MSHEANAARLLAAVQRSPELVAAHDRAGKRAAAGFLYAAARGDRQAALAQLATAARLESWTGAAMAPNDCIAVLREAEVGDAVPPAAASAPA